MGAGAAPSMVRRIANARLFLPAALVPLLLGLAICLVVTLIDPLDLRPWGLQPRFFDGNYPELVTPKLVRAVSGQHQDVILIGGSQAMGVTPAQLRQAFGAQKAFNLSYSLLEARDLAAVSDAAVRTPGLKRLIIELPFTATEWNRPPAPTGAGAITVLNAPWYALPDFGVEIARGSAERLSSGEFATSAWRKQAAEFLGSRTILQDQALIAELNGAFGRVPPATFAASSALPCGEFTVIGEALAPVVNEAAARNVELDFYFPPIPPPSYPRAEMQRSSGRFSWFRQLMNFHRCAILAVSRAGKPNAHVLAIDLDPAIVGNLSNFKDTFHLVRPDMFDRLLDDVRTHRFELRGNDSGAYVSQVSRLILAEYRRRGRLQ